jgi:hypothetical protein
MYQHDFGKAFVQKWSRGYLNMYIIIHVQKRTCLFCFSKYLHEPTLIGASEFTAV